MGKGRREELHKYLSYLLPYILVTVLEQGAFCSIIEASSELNASPNSSLKYFFTKKYDLFPEATAYKIVSTICYQRATLLHHSNLK